MFPGFNFGFSHGEPQQRQRQRPRQPQPPQQEDPLSTMWNGVSNFLGNSLQFPGFDGRQQQRQQQQRPRQAQQQQPRPNSQRPPQQQQHENRSGHNESQSNKQQKPPTRHEQKKPESPAIGSAIYWKDKGNQAFQKNDLNTAINCYSKAITQNDTESVFYSNRSRCYKLMGRWDEAAKDAQTAIELDDRNIKAHLISGQILAQMGKLGNDTKKIESAITRLTKALTLCSGQKKTQYESQLYTYINRAKKLLWYKQYDILRNIRINAINEYKKYLDSDGKLSPQQAELKLKEFVQSTNQSVQLHIPDYFCCKITLDLMKDPVVTDVGQTYERTSIEEHIKKNGKTDPFTREPISGNLYPNVALKCAIDSFIQSNPWAYEFKEDEDYKKIPF